MNASKISRAMAYRSPSITFLGRRTIPRNIDHTPRAHPEAPTGELPKSFAEYRKHALQHGPLVSGPAQRSAAQRSAAQRSAASFVDAAIFDRNQLPRRFWRLTISKHEQEVIESGGAAAWA